MDMTAITLCQENDIPGKKKLHDQRLLSNSYVC